MTVNQIVNHCKKKIAELKTPDIESDYERIERLAKMVAYTEVIEYANLRGTDRT